MKTEEKSSVSQVLPTHFKFHHDAGHGWLAVPYSAIEKLSIENQISTYSYRTGNTVYLEEDLDAMLFQRAYLKEMGHAPNDNKLFDLFCEHVYDGNTSYIRSYPTYRKGNATVSLPIKDARANTA